MVMVVAFLALQVGVSAYALWRGGGPERVVAIALLTAAGATLATPSVYGISYRTVFFAVLWIDIALLASLTMVAAFADRYWPMWLAALQLVAVGIHAVRGYDHSILAAAYWLVTTKMAYPMLAILLAGTLRHRRRLADGLPEPSWTSRDAGGRGDDRRTDPDRG